MGLWGGKQKAAQADVAELVKKQLGQVIDPDLGKDIVSLGFVKNIQVKGDSVSVVVELTTPACPVKEHLREQCEQSILAIDGVNRAEVAMTARTLGGNTAGKQVHESLQGIRNVVAVASGKGGVGKSTTALNLATYLAAKGSKVGILDADIYGPSMPLMTGANRPTEMVGDRVVPTEAHGIKVISVGLFNKPGEAAILRGPMAAQLITQFLTSVEWGELDYLVVDYPPGTGDIQLTLSQAAPITGAVIVTTPQEVSLIDVRKSVKMFATMKVPVLGIVENMSYFVCDGCDKKHRLFPGNGGEALAKESGVPLLAKVPMVPVIAEQCDDGLPGDTTGNPDHPAHGIYAELSGRVAAQLSILNAHRSGQLSNFSMEWN